MSFPWISKPILEAYGKMGSLATQNMVFSVTY